MLAWIVLCEDAVVGRLTEGWMENGQGSLLTASRFGASVLDDWLFG